MDKTSPTPQKLESEEVQEAGQAIRFGSSQKIVIVEDNYSLADIYKIRLELLGYKCFVAYDGQEALRIIEQELPDLVLLDLMVPKIAGDQILVMMRASDWGKHIKVQIISNLNEAEAPAGLREQGIEGYAVKANLSNDQLDQLVDNILKPAGQEEDVILESKTPGVIQNSELADTQVERPVVFQGLKSIIYPSANLAADKAFWAKASGANPYFEQPYYVGFNIGGGELGLDPNAIKEGLTYPVAYWQVADASATFEQFTKDGAIVNTELKDVGGGMMMATFKDATGNVFGIIDDPHSNIPE